MKMNGSRIRADFVAVDSRGNYHVFEAKHGNSGLTKNQRASGVFDMNKPSNKPENVVYSMNTSMENGFKSFSPTMRGTVDLPRNEEERKKTCEWIYTKVKDIYLPRTMNLIEIKPDAIKDIISFPDHYAYPFLTILYIIKKNNIILSDMDMDMDMEYILSKKITGNKSFDKNLLDIYL
ncbi:hypothetical protein [Photorhabdus temperata]|uniref:hypothetical protein n=1 Tax=Photorhabdus temperata TaxID=574560 RepID=UPI00038A1C83|nr:hypothetical protein [Photorhabdus temperata]EQB97872.1 Rhs family protein [Photorhabdus temperata subsp. temperata M1021]